MNYRNDDVIIAEMKEAKAKGDAVKCQALIVEMLLPEAEEVTRLSEKDITHKDGYASVMRFVSNLPRQYQPFMMKALEQVGYPSNTLASIKNILAI